MRNTRNAGQTCLTEGCTDDAVCKGLCNPCYAWDRYHMNAHHGIGYMVPYAAKCQRLVNRADAKIQSRRVHRISKKRRARA